jgi:hypothetical protein
MKQLQQILAELNINTPQEFIETLHEGYKTSTHKTKDRLYGEGPEMVYISIAGSGKIKCSDRNENPEPVNPRC